MDGDLERFLKQAWGKCQKHKLAVWALQNSSGDKTSFGDRLKSAGVSRQCEDRRKGGATAIITDKPEHSNATRCHRFICRLMYLNYLRSLGLGWSRQPLEGKGQGGKYAASSHLRDSKSARCFSRSLWPSVVRGEIIVILSLKPFTYPPLIFSRKWFAPTSPLKLLFLRDLQLADSNGPALGLRLGQSRDPLSNSRHLVCLASKTPNSPRFSSTSLVAPS